MIALTGASGFIGGALRATLAADSLVTIGRSQFGPRHIAVDLSADDAAALVASLRSYDVHCLVHAAGVTPWASDPDFTQDLHMAKTLVAICNELRIPRLLLLSGWVVYDPAATPPYTEQTPCRPVTPYGESKLAVEEYCAQHVRSTQCVVLRLASVYGPGQTSSGLIPNLVRQALRGEPLQLNARHTRRDYLYIVDAVAALRRLTDMPLPAGRLAVNLGSGHSVSVQEVAEAVQAAARRHDKHVAVTYDTALQEGTPADNQLDVTQARELGLLSSVTSFGDGIQAFVDWSVHAGVL